MLALPRDKCPIQGTPGERYRNHQLIRQLAPYDIDLGHMTNDLSVEEEKQMELFLKMRRETALGRGNVKELEDSTASELVSIRLYLGLSNMVLRSCMHIQSYIPNAHIRAVCRTWGQRGQNENFQNLGGGGGNGMRVSKQFRALGGFPKV